jgi:hypothetical protein
LEAVSSVIKNSPHQWFIPIILDTQEAEIRKIAVGSQSRQIVHETLSRKKPITHTHKKKAGSVAQAIRAPTYQALSSNSSATKKQKLSHLTVETTSGHT